jgi:uncharacterized membrane protein YfcA
LFIWEFLDDYAYLWGVIFVISGAFVNFYGRKMIKPTTFIMSFIVVTFTLSFVLYSLFYKNDVATWVAWVIMVLCAILGVVAGYFLTKYIKYGIALVGGASGCSFSLVLCNALQI